METIDYFNSLSDELHSLKKRVKYFISNNHPPTDGEWKESILRSVIRRSLPANIEVGRGFVVKSEGNSKQIDLLFYDNSKPILFRDGDLFFITPDATAGIIEVKTSMNDLTSFKNALIKLADNSQYILASAGSPQSDHSFFCGLFIYETNWNISHSQQILEIVREITNSKLYRIINHICIGKNILIKYWPYSPVDLRDNYNKWHFYYVENLSSGYFIHNIIHNFSQLSVGMNQKVWFPKEGKEQNGFNTIDF